MLGWALGFPPKPPPTLEPKPPTPVAPKPPEGVEPKPPVLCWNGDTVGLTVAAAAAGWPNADACDAPKDANGLALPPKTVVAGCC